MRPGDLVRRKYSVKHELGTFIGLRTFGGKTKGNGSYTCAEVMWFNLNAPNGDRVSTIQKDLIEVVEDEKG